MEFTDEQLTALLEALGLAEDADADADAIVAAAEELATAPTETAAASAETPTTVAASAARLGLQLVDGETLEARLARGDQAYARLEREDRERVVDAALGRGAITPARRDHFLQLMTADKDGTTALLASLPTGLAVPLAEVGHGQGGEKNVAASADAIRESDTYKNWSF